MWARYSSRRTWVYTIHYYLPLDETTTTNRRRRQRTYFLPSSNINRPAWRIEPEPLASPRGGDASLLRRRVLVRPIPSMKTEMAFRARAKSVGIVLLFVWFMVKCNCLMHCRLHYTTIAARRRWMVGWWGRKRGGGRGRINSRRFGCGFGLVVGCLFALTFLALACRPGPSVSLPCVSSMLKDVLLSSIISCLES